MIRIYCDDVYIDENYYAGIVRKGQLYSNAFRLGATLCEEYVITFAADGITAIPQVIKIYEDDLLKKTLFVDSFEKNKYEVILNAKDYMLKANVAYDASPLMASTGKTTLKAILDDICQKTGLTNDISEFVGSDMEVSWYNSDYSARTYLEFIGEINASYMYVTADNELIMEPVKKAPKYEISFDEVGDYTIGHQHRISRVVWDDGKNKWEFGDDSGETYYINTSNVYVISEEIVQNIFNAIVGFEYWNANVVDFPLDGINVGDIVNFGDEDVSYTTIIQYPDALNYSGGYWLGGMSLDINSKEQQETQVIGDDNLIKHLQVIVDRNANQISQIITETKLIEESVSDISQKTEDMENDVEETRELIKTLSSEITQNNNSIIAKIEEVDKRIDDGVEIVKNKLVTIDINGITVSTTTSAISTLLSNDRFSINSKSGELFFVGYDYDLKKTVSRIDNLTVTNYLTAGYHRTEKFKINGENRTGDFYVGV